MITSSLKQQNSNSSKGIILVLLAYFVFSCLDTGIKWLTIAGFSVFQLAFLRFVLHFFLAVGAGLYQGAGIRIMQTDKVFLIIVRSVLLGFTTVLNFIAIKYLPLTLTATIFFSTPIIVCALSFLLLGERVGPYRWMAIIVGFVGVLIAMRPFHVDFHWATIPSFAAACTFALYMIFTRKLATKVPTRSMQIYGSLIPAILVAPIAILEAEQIPLQQINQNWPVLLSIGFLGWLGHEFMIKASNYTEVGILSIFNYSIIIFLTIWSITLFGQWPDRWTVIGAAIISTAGIFIWIRERHLENKK